MWLCTSRRGHVFFHTFPGSKNCSGKFVFNGMSSAGLNPLAPFTHGHQTYLKVATCFSSAWILFKYALWAWLKVLAEYECLRFMCLSTENPGIEDAFKMMDHHKLSCPCLSICHQISPFDPLPGHFLEVSWLLIIFQVNEANGNMFLICPVFVTGRRWQKPAAGSASCLG